MMVSMFIFALLALALTKTLSYSKYLAEDNLYEATTLTVASSLIEQIKGASLDLLINPQKVDGKEGFEMFADGTSRDFLFYDTVNDLQVPVVTDSLGSSAKTLDLRVNPSVTRMSDGDGFWIEIEYEYDHPRTQRTRTRTLRNARSTVPSS
jgi:type II secretory pathway pseudopilin PulG